MRVLPRAPGEPRMLARRLAADARARSEPKAAEAEQHAGRVEPGVHVAAADLDRLFRRSDEVPAQAADERPLEVAHRAAHVCRGQLAHVSGIRFAAMKRLNAADAKKL